MLSSLRILSISTSESFSLFWVSSQRLELALFSLTSILLSDKAWLLILVIKLVGRVYLRWCLWIPLSLEEVASLENAEGPIDVSAVLSQRGAYPKNFGPNLLHI